MNKDERIKETVHMLDMTVTYTWDKLSKEKLKIIIDAYLEMLKEDTGL